jgi:hypothetical protein
MKGENEGKKKKSVADDKSLCFFVTNIDLYKKKKTYQDSSNVDLKKFKGSKHKIPKDKKKKIHCEYMQHTMISFWYSVISREDLGFL